MEKKFTALEYAEFQEYQELKRMEEMRQQNQPSILGAIFSGVALFGAFAMGMDLHHFLNKD